MVATTNTPLYELSIRIFPDGFSFVLQQQGGVQIELYEEILQNKQLYQVLWQKLAELPIQIIDHVETIVTLHHTSYTLVPKTLYRPDDASLWLGMMKDKVSVDIEIRAQELSVYDCVLLFEVPRKLSELVLKMGKTPTFRSIAAELLESAINVVQTPTTALFLYAEKRQIHLVAIKEGKLLLANCFDIRTTVDVLYHLLQVVDTMELLVEKLQLHVTGCTDLTALKQTLYPYFIIANENN